MRNRMSMLCAAVALTAMLILLPTALPGRAENAEGLDNWTVLIYMCGSDLETNSGMASYNLHEIMLTQVYDWTIELDEASGQIDYVEVPLGVNVLLETGGALEWHNEAGRDGRDWGLEIANDRLQRYQLEICFDEVGANMLTLVEELPQASMAEPDTLAEFIRWGVERCPARKYLLVLWGHGGGSSTGLIIDEPHGNDILMLYELEQALAAAETHFEAVLLDACLMGSLETAQALAPYADWMVGSEELAPGYGTAFRDWLRELFLDPDCDGRRIGREICDATHRKYRAIENNSGSMMTWSVVDLSAIERVSQAFDSLIGEINHIYEKNRDTLSAVVLTLFNDYNQPLGTGEECMYDLGTGLLEDTFTLYFTLRSRNALMDALRDAVVYTSSGLDAADDYGLSFCFPVTMTPEQLNVYALNCHSAVYLAFLDAAVPNWEAPDWVYAQTDRLTPSEQIERFGRLPEQRIVNGLPELCWMLDDLQIISCYFELFCEDASTGGMNRLGLTLPQGEQFQDENWNLGARVYLDGSGTWPSIDGKLCSVEFKQLFAPSDYYETGRDIAFENIPIQVGSEYMNLSIGNWEEYNAKLDRDVQCYKIYGVTEGFDHERGMPSRNSNRLSQFQQQEFRLLYPIEPARNKRTHYASSEPMKLYSGMQIELTPLPEGYYYVDYIIVNCLKQELRTPMVKIYWDGAAFTAVEE